MAYVRREASLLFMDRLVVRLFQPTVSEDFVIY